MAPALTASLYLTVVLRFLLPLPASSPNLGSAVELGGTASRVASELGERLGRGRSGVRIGKWASRGEDGGVPCKTIGYESGVSCK